LKILHLEAREYLTWSFFRNFSDSFYCIEEITRVVRDSDNGDIKGELYSVKLLLIVLMKFLFWLVVVLIC